MLQIPTSTSTTTCPVIAPNNYLNIFNYISLSHLQILLLPLHPLNSDCWPDKTSLAWSLVIAPSKMCVSGPTAATAKIKKVLWNVLLCYSLSLLPKQCAGFKLVAKHKLRNSHISQSSHPALCPPVCTVLRVHCTTWCIVRFTLVCSVRCAGRSGGCCDTIANS